MKNIIAAVVALAIAMAGCAGEEPKVTSPSGKVEFKILESADGLGFEIQAGEGTLRGRLGLSLAEKATDTINLQQGDPNPLSATGRSRLRNGSAAQKIEDEYVMRTGKKRLCSNTANERVFTLAAVDSMGRDAFEYQLIVRAYDDGVAFRYALPQAAAGGDDALAACTLREETAFVVPRGTKRWMQPYKPEYEGYYPLATDGADGHSSKSKHKHMWGFPALIEAADSVFMLITESDIRRGNAAAHLNNSVAADSVYAVALPPSVDAEIQGPRLTPWRVVIAGSLADVVESTLVTDVASPCAIGDDQWVRPGLASWVYWAYNHGSKDFGIVKDYIDLAAEMGWPYMLIDWEWDQMDGGGDISDATAYARARGVMPMMWYNSCTAWVGDGAPGPMYRLNTRDARKREMQWLDSLGVAGIKVDFFESDAADAMAYCIDLMQSAAEHRKAIVLHGVTAPRGWQRTYPNLMTMEGVRGAEWYNNTDEFGPRAAEHNATLPFTRNVVGSMDYTPGTFTDSQHPHFTTDAHELALCVLFESGVQHMPDRPSAYRALPQQVKALLSDLPAAWDETRLLGGYPGRYAAMARRSGNQWYIAAINGTDEPLALNLDLAPYLAPGAECLVIADADSLPAPFPAFAITRQPLPQAVTLAPRGGLVILPIAPQSPQYPLKAKH